MEELERKNPGMLAQRFDKLSERIAVSSKWGKKDDVFTAAQTTHKLYAEAEISRTPELRDSALLQRAVLRTYGVIIDFCRRSNRPVSAAEYTLPWLESFCRAAKLSPIRETARMMPEYLARSLFPVQELRRHKELNTKATAGKVTDLHRVAVSCSLAAAEAARRLYQRAWEDGLDSASRRYYESVYTGWEDTVGSICSEQVALNADARCYRERLFWLRCYIRLGVPCTKKNAALYQAAENDLRTLYQKTADEWVACVWHRLAEYQLNSLHDEERAAAYYQSVIGVSRVMRSAKRATLRVLKMEDDALMFFYRFAYNEKVETRLGNLSERGKLLYLMRDSFGQDTSREAADVYCEMAELLERNGNLREARECFIRAVKLTPRSGERFAGFYRRCGDMALRHGNGAEAERCYLAALGQHDSPRSRTSACCHEALGDIKRRSGDRAAAKRHYSAALVFFEASAAAFPEKPNLRAVCKRLREKLDFY